jgi:hypothetical protein
MNRMRTLQDPATLALFRQHVDAALYDEYHLEEGEAIVKGQSFTHLKNRLRDEGWRGVSRYYVLKEALEWAGYRVVRGRGKRIYHGGHYGLGVPCDVVTTKQPN